MRASDADGDDALSSSPEPDFDQDRDDSDAMEGSKGENSTAQKSPQGNGNTNNNNTSHAKSNAKDPNRPRRKKARRACFACQRAHLTCGDERPCERCIKRGLQDQCEDGVRKKAKYLHDAPAEALKPGFAKNFVTNGSRPSASMPTPGIVDSNGMSNQQSGAYFDQTGSGRYPHYGLITEQSPITSSLMGNVPIPNDFGQQQGLDSPTQFHSNATQQMSPEVGDLPHDANPMANLGGPANAQFNSSFADPADPSMFDFNLADLNFDNHYGALEFGMLGHMSSAAAGNSDFDILNSVRQNQGTIYDGFNPGFGYNQNMQSWQTVPNAGSRSGSATNLWNVPPNGLDAFAVGEHSSVYSPHSQDFNAGLQPSTMSPESQFSPSESAPQQQELLRHSLSHAQQQQQQNRKKRSAFPASFSAGGTTKRRDTSEIYDSVTAPYPYTQRFHALIAFLQKHFPSRKVLSIAKALASIRPSFISCNKSLDTTDLIFAEKCFQRTLVEYEDFVNHYATPTVIIRRTGEIAAVSQEFTLLTGWKRSVLLGKEANLNVNISGGHGSGTQTGASTRGAATPRMPPAEFDTSQPQPVFIAELLDEDSVVEFYDDFAELAFGASRASIIGKPCSLLTYKTKETMGYQTGDSKPPVDEDTSPMMKNGQKDQRSRVPASVLALSEKNGRVDCQLCWTVKRDMFDIPMLIILNFLPDI